MSALTIALSKGRILEESLPLLGRIGLAPAGDLDRLLRVPSRDKNVSLLIVRPADVPTYVEYGAADLGIVGKDVLMEHGGAALYEPLDLGIAQCRLSVAAKKEGPRPDGVRRLLPPAGVGRGRGGRGGADPARPRRRRPPRPHQRRPGE